MWYKADVTEPFGYKLRRECYAYVSSLRWVVAAVSVVTLLALASACTREVQVPGDTVVVKKELFKEVQGERFVSDKWGELAERPQYGGSMTVAIYDTPAWSGFDAYHAGGGFWSALVLDKLGDFNWGYNRAEFGIISRYKDHNHVGGILAES